MDNSLRLSILSVFLGALLIGCSPTRNEFTYAPVYSPTANMQMQGSQYHTVQRGDTLYSIAWRYNMDYRTLARMNGISAPYALAVDQKILLKWPSVRYKQAKAVQAKPKRIKSASRAASRPVPARMRNTRTRESWSWPIQGKLVDRYNPKKGLKGINIAGQYGQKIRASRSGYIAYASNGLRDYGNLIIIKHNNEFLSAYAHNKRMYVKEGQYVKKGQVIGLMGRNSKGRHQLHFEIRKTGEPVNPLRYLAKS